MVKPCFPNAPRCQAKSKRHGGQCGGPAMKGKRVCQIHGGKSTGRPVTTGQYTKEAKAERLLSSKLMRQFNALAKELGAT